MSLLKSESSKWSTITELSYVVEQLILFLIVSVFSDGLHVKRYYEGIVPTWYLSFQPRN